MALPLLEKDLAYISKLDTYPNDVGGMSAEELKAAFDAASQDIQNYINKLLIPQIESDIDAASQGVSSGEGIDGSRLIENSVPDSKIFNLNGDKIDNGTIGTEKHKKGSITRELLSEDAKTVQTEDLPNKVIPGRALEDNTIPFTKYADGSITLEKLSEALQKQLSDIEMAVNNTEKTLSDLGAELDNVQTAIESVETALDEKIERTKLWQNAKMSSAFNAQTVSLNLSGYKSLQVDFAYDSQGAIATTIELRNVSGTYGLAYVADIWENGFLLGIRQNQVKNNGIYFGAVDTLSWTGSSGTKSVNPYMLIPYSIYGIKGGD